MSDFLVGLGGARPGAGLLELLRLPYGSSSRAGQCFDFGWGSAAILGEPDSGMKNVHESPLGILGSAGDLLAGDLQKLAEGLLVCAANVRSARLEPAFRLQDDSSFASLNGAFAILLADDNGPSVITDPLGSVQVYVGRNRKGVLTAIGTHPDLVALISGHGDEIDPVSVFEFLNAGTPCFPHTMHKGVRELAPGRLHVIRWDENETNDLCDLAWWRFPDEFDSLPPEEELAANLGNAFTAAVHDRCRKGTVGVTLSGGLDSRLVMAAVPESMRCIGFTFLDVMNRESRTARKVAQCYNREWVPLVRDHEYIARTATDTVRLVGCEGDWVNAHGLGFEAEIAKYNVSTVLSGLLMNNNVKGFYAADIQRVPRWGGLLPPRYEIGPYDYVGELKVFSAGLFRDGLLESARSRRKAFLKEHPGLKRQSVAEWLDGYPFSQAPDNTAWVAERRLMPVKLPAMDRRLLDTACRIPMSSKAGGTLFARMARPIFGKGANIPDANDGVRPGSKHLSRLLQRAVRKLENNRREILNGLGLTLPVPTSWHDYQRYWRESRLLGKLFSEHGKNLRDFDGAVFASDPQAACKDPEFSWLYGFRLLQLGLWKSCLREYGTAARCSPDKRQQTPIAIGKDVP